MTKVKEGQRLPCFHIVAKSLSLHRSSPCPPLPAISPAPVSGPQCAPHITCLMSEFLLWFLYSQHEELLSQALDLLCLAIGNPISTFKPTTNRQLEWFEKKPLFSLLGLQLRVGVFLSARVNTWPEHSQP